MYTTETSAGSDSIAAQRQVSPHTNRYLVPGLSFEGGIFKEQQRTFLTRLVLPNLARMFNGQQQTTFLSRVSRIRPKVLRRWAPGVGSLGAWVGQKAESPRRAVRVPRQVLPQGSKTRVQVFADIQNFAPCAHCVCTACALRARHSPSVIPIEEVGASLCSLE